MCKYLVPRRARFDSQAPVAAALARVGWQSPAPPISRGTLPAKTCPAAKKRSCRWAAIRAQSQIPLLHLPDGVTVPVRTAGCGRVCEDGDLGDAPVSPRLLPMASLPACSGSSSPGRLFIPSSWSASQLPSWIFKVALMKMLGMSVALRHFLFFFPFFSFCGFSHPQLCRVAGTPRRWGVLTKGNCCFVFQTFFLQVVGFFFTSSGGKWSFGCALRKSCILSSLQLIAN